MSIELPVPTLHRPKPEPGLVALWAFPLLLFATLLIGCGISFGDEDVETELFKSLEFGVAVAGEPVTVTLEYAQQYPVQLEVVCDLLSVVDIPTITPLATQTVSPLALRRTPQPTLATIPRIRPTPAKKVLKIFGTTLLPNEDGGPVGEATPVLGNVERRFIAPEAGDYTVWCYTPADQNNAIFEDISISP